MSRVTSWMPTPRKPRVTEPFLMRSVVICLTVAAGMAKAMPTLPPLGEKIAVLTPTTSPLRLKSGPPELPLFTAASICM